MRYGLFSTKAIKNRASSLRKSDYPHLTHFDCLNMASIEAGFQNYNHAKKHLPEIGFVRVSFEFLWHDRVINDSAGHVIVTVKPIEHISADELDRLVFVIPEFFVDVEHGAYEHFRIDSAYFNRVTSVGNAVYSQQKRITAPSRNIVISFHLYEGRWHAGIYKYNCDLSTKEMELEIKKAVSNKIIETVYRFKTNDKNKPNLITPFELSEDEKLFGANEREITESYRARIASEIRL